MGRSIHLRLVMENAKDAEDHGAKILLHTEIDLSHFGWGRVRGIKVKDLCSGEEYIDRCFLSHQCHRGLGKAILETRWPSYRYGPLQGILADYQPRESAKG